MITKVTERSLYPFLTAYLKELKFDSFSEIGIDSGQADILAQKEDEKFIIELKIGNDSKTKILDGLQQALNYARDLNTTNIIVIDYPQSIRECDLDRLEYTLLNIPANALVSTDYLNQSCNKKSAKEIFDKLNKNFEDRRVAEVDINLIITVVSEAIEKVTQTLKNLNQKDKNILIKLITGKYDLFLSLSDLEDENESNTVALNLISYLVVNQILFYHIFAKKSQQIPELEKLETIDDLRKQFQNITSIDYKSIYQINIVDKLPNDEDIVSAFNEVIEVFKCFQPELVEHDLLGRLFHELLPYETRKILAAFYTNTKAAEILSVLAIDNYDDKVIDPACGSGTLLVSSYNRKKYLTPDEQFSHKKIVEDELTGLDIMPFAAHLTAVNLSSQSIETTTEKLNVGVMDSLGLSNKLKNSRVYEVENFSRELQVTMDYYKNSNNERFNSYISKQAMGSVGADGEDSSFKIRKNSFDVFIANPPFSDREKMPNDYLNILKGYKELTDICGSRVNLWGYFLALSKFLLKKDGTLAVIIPLNIFRGAATQKIRDYIFDNFTIKYVVKTGKNIAFSENAGFRDIIIIANNKEPRKNNKVKYVIIKEDLHKLSLSDARDVGKYIKEEIIYSNIDVETTVYKQSQLKEYSKNLMPYFGLSSIENSIKLNEFRDMIKTKLGDKLRKLKSEEISEGFHASPKGTSQMTFITIPYNKNRIKRAFLIYSNEDKNHVYVYPKKVPDILFKIPKNILLSSFRSLTDISQMNINERKDYLISDEFENFEKLLDLSNFKNKKEFSYKNATKNINSYYTYMVVARRFNPSSPNTSFFAFCSDEKFISPHTFKSLFLDDLDSKINTLFLNSVIGILDVILLKEDSTGKFTDIMQSDLLLLNILDKDKLSKEELEDLLDLYDEIGELEFESLTEQFDKQTPNRIKLDKNLLSILGFSEQEIQTILPTIYELIAFELKQKEKKN